MVYTHTHTYIYIYIYIYICTHTHTAMLYGMEILSAKMNTVILTEICLLIL